MMNIVIVKTQVSREEVLETLDTVPTSQSVK